jgi:peptidoglycan/LPS O-acetylase OafA/YrhL
VSAAAIPQARSQELPGMSDAHKSAKFVTLDGLRGFAALAVMIFHFQDHTKLMGGWAPFKAGSLAVDFFFVLSGFVIAHAYERRFSAGMSMGQFVGARLIRLAPMYLFGTALAVAYAVVLRWRHYYSHPDPSKVFILDIFLALFAIPILQPLKAFYPFNFPAWSLIYELIANIAYRLSFKLLSVRILIGLVALSYVATFIKFRTFGTSVGIGYFAPDSVKVIYGFFAGVLVYQVWSRSTFRPKVPAWLLVVAILLLLVDKKYEHYAAAAFPVLVYFGASAQFTRITGRIFVILGELSFGIYMIHAAVMDFALKMVDRLHGASASDWGPCAAVPTAIAVIFLAFVSYHIYDVPVRSRMMRLLRRPSSKLSVGDGLTPTAAERLAGGRS